MGMMLFLKQPTRLHWIPQPLFLNRLGNDDFAARDPWGRLMHDLNAWIWIAGGCFADDPELRRAFMGVLRRNQDEQHVRLFRQACGDDRVRWEHSREQLLRVGYPAEALNVSPATIRRLIADGVLERMVDEFYQYQFTKWAEEIKAQQNDETYETSLIPVYNHEHAIGFGDPQSPETIARRSSHGADERWNPPLDIGDAGLHGAEAATEHHVASFGFLPDLCHFRPHAGYLRPQFADVHLRSWSVPAFHGRTQRASLDHWLVVLGGSPNTEWGSAARWRKAVSSP